MASIETMKKRMEKVHNKHSKTAERLAALKAKFEEEEKALRNEQDKVNNEWARHFADVASQEDIQINMLNVEQLVELVKENLSVLIEEPASPSPDDEEEVDS